MASYAFDIETAMNRRAQEIISKRIYKANSNIKDSEKKAKNIEEKREKDIQKAALSGITGRVTCAVFKNLDSGEVHEFSDTNERFLLTRIGNFLVEDGTIHRLIAKNIEFDRTFLIFRYLYFDLGIPAPLRTIPIDCIDDIDKIFSLKQSNPQISTLENYANGFDIKGKLADGQGAMDLFYDWYMCGNDDSRKKLLAYCKQDVEITAEIYRRASKNFLFDKSYLSEDIPF